VSKVLLIAAREFVATVFTKAFIIGLLVFPAMVGVMSLVGPKLFGPDPNFAIAGQLAVIDPTGEVTPQLRAALTKGTPAANLADLIRAVDLPVETHFMAISRFSHIMHITSTVVGRLRPGATALQILSIAMLPSQRSLASGA